MSRFNQQHTPNSNNTHALRLDKYEVNLLLFRERDGVLTDLEHEKLEEYKRSSPDAKTAQQKVELLFQSLKTEKADPNKIKTLLKDLFGQISDNEKRDAYNNARQRIDAAHPTVLRSCLQHKLSATRQSELQTTLSEYETALTLILDILSARQMQFWEDKNGKKTINTYVINNETIHAFWEEFFKLFPALSPEEITSLKEKSLLVVKTGKDTSIFLANPKAKAEYTLGIKTAEYIRQQQALGGKVSTSPALHTQLKSSNSAIRGAVEKKPLTLEQRAQKEKSEYSHKMNALLQGEHARGLNLQPDELASLNEVLTSEKATSYLEKSVNEKDDLQTFMRKFYSVVITAKLTKERATAIAKRMAESFLRLMEELSAQRRLETSHAASMAHIKGKRERERQVEEESTLELESNEDRTLLGNYLHEEEKRLTILSSSSSEMDRKKAAADKFNFSHLSNHPERIENLETYLSLDFMDTLHSGFLKAIIIGAQHFKTLESYRGFLLQIAKRKKVEVGDVQLVYRAIDELLKAKGEPKKVEVAKKDYDVYDSKVQAELISQIVNSQQTTEYFAVLFEIDVAKHSLGLFNTLMGCRTLQTLEDQMFSPQQITVEKRNRETRQKEMATETVNIIKEEDRGLFQNVMFDALDHVSKGRKITGVVLQNSADKYVDALNAKESSLTNEVVEEISPEKQQVQIVHTIVISANGLSDKLADVLTYKFSEGNKASYKNKIVEQLAKLTEESSSLRELTEKMNIPGNGSELYSVLTNLAGLGTRMSPSMAITTLLDQFTSKVTAPQGQVSTRPPSQADIARRQEEMAKKLLKTEARIIDNLMSDQHKDTLRTLFGKDTDALRIELTTPTLSLKDYVSKLRANKVPEEVITKAQNAIAKIASIAANSKMPMPTAHAVQAYIEEQSQQKAPTPVARPIAEGISATSVNTANYGRYTQPTRATPPTPPNPSNYFKK